ncbi:MAG: long-chain fatty acid--CoA ligase [Ignavibacteriales bacterium CG18_big_fil_WC_8_21_14_2_50_31_20]|nr:MAG: long-chain fatty acid--CoA ligase [Ignavibacteriales bacterium CG18_big_fil_WC_8_21_14_2_50_31_20]
MLKKYTLAEVLNQSAEKYADNVALSSIDGYKLNYKELKEKVKSVSAFLKESGILPGDKVAILSENSVNWGIAYFAITTMGAIGVPIMTEFKSTEIKHILKHSESKAIFVSSKQFEKIEETNSEELQIKILLDNFSIIPNDTKTDILKSALTEGLKEFQKIKFAALKLVGLTDETINEDDLALILYTSGTTGHSKGVMLTHKNITYDAVETIKLVHFASTDITLSILPLYHTYEATLGLVTPMLAGASVYYLNKPPTPAVLLPAMKKVKPTVMLSVPLVIEKIYRNRVLPEINKKSVTRNLYKLTLLRKKMNAVAGKKLKETFGGNLRLFCIGGSALAADVEQFLQEAKFPYSMGYGLTETSPLVTGTDNFRVRFRSAGYLLNGMEIKIDSPNEKGVGEVLIKGPNVMKGYYKDPEKTAEIFTEDGWFCSGDLGVMDKDGYLFLKGRSKNVIIGSNGKNIYPEEVEAIINEQRFVAESLVLDRDGKLEARIYLNYEQIDEVFQIAKLNETQARKITDEILKDIFTKSNERLNSFSKLIKYVEQVEPFEKTPTQKVKRFLYS